MHAHVRKREVSAAICVPDPRMPRMRRGERFQVEDHAGVRNFGAAVVQSLRGAV